MVIMPDVVRNMSPDARLNQWGCWCEEMSELAADTMVDIDVGDDGVPVVTFGLDEFDNNLHADLNELVEDYILAHEDFRSGRIEARDRDRAVLLALGLERAARMIRESLA